MGAIFWGSVEKIAGWKRDLLRDYGELYLEPRGGQPFLSLRVLRWWHLPSRRCYAFHRDMVVNAAGWCDYMHCKDKNFYK
jgi:hypothetical protein